MLCLVNLQCILTHLKPTFTIDHSHTRTYFTAVWSQYIMRLLGISTILTTTLILFKNLKPSYFSGTLNLANF